jgi:hypothetical protein
VSSSTISLQYGDMFETCLGTCEATAQDDTAKSQVLLSRQSGALVGSTGTSSPCSWERAHPCSDWPQLQPTKIECHSILVPLRFCTAGQGKVGEDASRHFHEHLVRVKAAPLGNFLVGIESRGATPRGVVVVECQQSWHAAGLPK